MVAALTMTACGDADELTPDVITDNDEAIVLPAPPRLSDAERDIISQQRQEMEDFVAGGGVKSEAKTQKVTPIK